MINDSRKIKEIKSDCNHDFVFSGKFTEGIDYIYREVGYSVCRNCGEIRKNVVK